MKAENKDYLLSHFPVLFQEHGKKPPESPFAAYGFEIDDGWFEMVKKLCEDITALDPPPDFRVVQVKEKFGGLRFYCSGYPYDTDRAKSEAIGRLIGKAENDSMRVCERCGSTEGVTLSGGWVKAYCTVHREEREAAEKERLEKYKAEREAQYAAKAKETDSEG